MLGRVFHPYPLRSDQSRSSEGQESHPAVPLSVQRWRRSGIGRSAKAIDKLAKIVCIKGGTVIGLARRRYLFNALYGIGEEQSFSRRRFQTGAKYNVEIARSRRPCSEARIQLVNLNRL